MKKDKILRLMLVCGMAAICVSVGWMVAERHVWRMPGKIVPAAVVLPLDGRMLRDAGDRERLAAALGVLHRRLDSLAADSAGRRSYDSLLRARPGLLDSLSVAERYFSLEGLNH